MRGTDGDQDRVSKRREIATLAKLHFLLEIACEIVVAGKLNRRAKGRVSLHEDFAWRFAAPGASGNLGKKLKCPFARTDIGEMQREIRIDDADECDVRKMQTFRDHLCADENVNLSCAEVSQSFAI